MCADPIDGTVWISRAQGACRGKPVHPECEKPTPRTAAMVSVPADDPYVDLYMRATQARARMALRAVLGVMDACGCSGSGPLRDPRGGVALRIAVHSANLGTVLPRNCSLSIPLRFGP